MDRGINYIPCDLGNAFSGNLSLAVTYPKADVKKQKTKTKNSAESVELTSPSCSEESETSNINPLLAGL
jgi:hypothetical protein